MTHEEWSQMQPTARMIGWFAFLLGGVKAVLVLLGLSAIPALGSAASVAMTLMGLVLLAVSATVPGSQSAIRVRIVAICAAVVFIVVAFPFGMSA